MTRPGDHHSDGGCILPAEDEPHPVVVFHNGRMLTMERGAPPDATVLVTRGGRIEAVGGRELLQRYPHASHVDLAGCWLCPGFIDAHNHLSIAALHPLWADLSAVRNEEELANVLRAQAARDPHAPWVRGANWNEVETGLLPDRRMLDRIGLDRPILIAHYTLHQGVVCSRGLDELGIGRSTPDPPGGMIARDWEGNPSGLLVERAWSEAHARSVMPYRDRDRHDDWIVERAQLLLAEGITCVHDAACPPAAEQAYWRLARSNRLPISVLVMPHAEAILRGQDPQRWHGPPTGEGDEWLRVGPMKFFADGGIAPALDVCAAGIRMQMGMEFTDLQAELERAVAHGFRVAVHAIGNAGLERALSSFAEIRRRNPSADLRFRVEHACLASEEQLRRLRELGGVAVVQPGFLHHLGEAVLEVRFDNATWLPFGTMMEIGLPLAASSDDPCALRPPLLTASYGASRRTASARILDPSEAVPYEEWLRAYTIGAAYAGGQEHERGSLAPGKRADLVVLHGELDSMAPPRVVQTWVAGKLGWGELAPLADAGHFRVPVSAPGSDTL
ncbi:MAG: amidohydrolase [Candidatus Binatia bacterium]|nr:amidohydrolase [Candidatus Binatia bacterium]